MANWQYYVYVEHIRSSQLIPKLETTATKSTDGDGAGDGTGDGADSDNAE